MHSLKHVTVALALTNAAARQKLRGIFRYIAEGRDWDVRLIRSPDTFTPETIRTATADGTNGYIVSIPDSRAALDVISAQEVPLVAIEIDHHSICRRENVAHMRTDNVGIGRMAAEHLLRLGYFKSYVFIPDSLNLYWSKARSEGFGQTLLAHGKSMTVFTTPRHGDFHRALVDGLRKWPRPIGIFAAWDYVAAEALSCCHDCGISVPDQASVLGVDNDEFICESTRPSLSTILVNREKQGYDAAAALDSLMQHSGRCRPRTPICRPVKVIERESTAPLVPREAIVERALDLIARNATSPIAPADVAARLRVSRRLLDLRFRETGSRTIAQTIREQRLKRIRHLLLTTSQSDVRIADHCGFTNVNTMRNMFRSAFGVSPRQFKAAQKPSTKLNDLSTSQPLNP